MAEQTTERIRLWGIVQGVGFRPYVAKVAAALGMKGTVSNIGGLVEIYVTDTEQRDRLRSFMCAVIRRRLACLKSSPSCRAERVNGKSR